MKLRKKDKVIVTIGRDRGKEGSIERVYEKQDKVLIEGLNMYKRHIKKNEQMPDGGVIDVPRPLNVSKVSLVCPKCKKPTRIGYKIEDGKKVRMCRKCEKVI